MLKVHSENTVDELLWGDELHWVGNRLISLQNAVLFIKSSI